MSSSSSPSGFTSEVSVSLFKCESTSTPPLDSLAIRCILAVASGLNGLTFLNRATKKPPVSMS